MTIDMSQFHSVFFDEAEELLAEKERLLLALDVAAPDPEDLNAIFRAAHSIKGGAATFGFTDITEVTHILESLLDKARNGEIKLRAEMVDAFLEAKDVVKGLLDGHRHGVEADDDAVTRVCATLQALAAQNAPEADSAGESASAAAPVPAAPAIAAPVPATPVPASGPLQRYRLQLREVGDRDVAALLQELGHLGEFKKQEDDQGSLILTLDTTCSRDDLISICCFIVDIDQLVIEQESPGQPAELSHNADPAAQSPAKVEEDPGYGFFAELHAALGLSESSAPASSPSAPTSSGGAAHE